MADKTFGVKVSEELYNRVKTMIDNSGDNAKEWFEKAVSIAELQSIKQGAAEYSQDLNELEVHTARIYELISNMIQRSIYIKDNAVKVVADKLEQREAIIGEYQEKSSTALEELKLTKELLKVAEQEKEDLTKQLENQRGTLENNQSLINEYKEKIDTLSSLVNQYKDFAAENAELKKSFAAEKESMKAEFQDKESRLLSVNEELKATAADQQERISSKEKEIESLKVNHVNELTWLTNEKNLERERAVLEVERKFQEKTQQLQEEYHEKIARLYEKLDRLNDKENNNDEKQ